MLRDRWERGGPIPLNGFLERHAFPPLLMAVLVPVGAFLLFQLSIVVILVPFLLLQEGASGGETDLMQDLFQEHIGEVLIANSIGQLVGLAAPALLITWLHSSRILAFLRLRAADLRLLLLAFLGWIGLYPIVSWMGALNERLPLPDVLEQMDQQQLELIEQVLMSDMGVPFNLLVLAIVPALCEEVLFRGYVQRQAERGLGGRGGILLSGLLFGFFHLRLSQVLPLCVLGFYLAYLVWQTGSLWPAVVVHFANNAFAVLAGSYVSSHPELNLENIEQMNMPWYGVLVGFLLLGGVLYVLQQWTPTLRRHRQPASAHLPDDKKEQ